MGEYAIFVWPCYAAVVVLLSALCFLSWKNMKKDEQTLKELQDQLNKTSKQE